MSVPVKMQLKNGVSAMGSEHGPAVSATEKAVKGWVTGKCCNMQPKKKKKNFKYIIIWATLNQALSNFQTFNLHVNTHLVKPLSSNMYFLYEKTKVTDDLNDGLWVSEGKSEFLTELKYTYRPCCHLGSP